jgi:TonB-dependent starch-binding outer membrane protein SusC
MQVFATSKAAARGRVVPQLTLKYRQAVRIMKITGILILAACMQVSANGITQTITLNVKNAPLEQVFKTIKKQTNYFFFYRAELLKDAKKVTVDAKNMPLQQVLDLCFKDQPFTYSISGKYITIIPKKNGPVEFNVSSNLINIDVRGRVVNENGDPIQASIILKGTKTGTTTNQNGEFRLSNVKEDAILVISGVGIEQKEFKLNGLSQIIITVKIAIKPLDEVQMIAYGQTTKRFQTGNVTTIKGSDIEKQPVQNLLFALEGRVPGLFITQSSGLPGTGATVRIQGKNSIANGNDPLYVIDGVPYPSQLLPNLGKILGNSGQGSNGLTTNGNPLSYINASDVESITILKDADATAIYGSRGANGVILIITKKGKAGRNLISVNYKAGWGKVTRKLDLLNRRQYLDMRYEAISNDGTSITDPNIYAPDLLLWDTTISTDWQKELIGGTANYTNLQTTFSGGSENVQYLLSGSYNKETTVFPGDLSDRRGSFHFNINSTSINKKFSFQVSGNFLSDNNRLINQDLTQSALYLAPTAPKIYNQDGTLNWATDQSGNETWSNPLAYLNSQYKNNTINLLGNINVSYQVLPFFNLKVSIGYNNIQTKEFVGIPSTLFNPIYLSRSGNSIRRANHSNNGINSWIIEPQANYKKKFNKITIDALLGSTFQKKNDNGTQLMGAGFNNDLILEDIKSAASITTLSSTLSTYKYAALFSRVGFNFADRYLINLTGRRDGTSRFGPENQFHNFGAIGIGWIFSNEQLIKNSFNFLNFGKLSTSYGTTGSDQIPDYRYLDLYTPINVGNAYQGLTSYGISSLYNPLIKWEETKKLHVGLDLGFFSNDRLLLNIGYFNNRTTNQLMGYKLPSTTGFTSIFSNLPATVENSGIEMSLTTVNIKVRNFEWNSFINLTIPKNKLASFPNLSSSTYAGAFVIGDPIAIIKAFKFWGVDPSTGVYQFASSSGTPTSYPTAGVDDNLLINTLPKYFGGFSNSFSYGNFQLDILFQFVKQKGYNYFGFAPGEPTVNQPTTVLNRWQKPGDITNVQRFNQDYLLGDIFSFATTRSDMGFTDASFIRLKNVSFSYQFSKSVLEKLKIKETKLFIQGQNLLTFTNYKGLDPENTSSTSLPPLKVLVLGLNVIL